MLTELRSSFLVTLYFDIVFGSDFNQTL
jgi:hypothetical protein